LKRERGEEARKETVNLGINAKRKAEGGLMGRSLSPQFSMPLSKEEEESWTLVAGLPPWEGRRGGQEGNLGKCRAECEKEEWTLESDAGAIVRIRKHIEMRNLIDGRARKEGIRTKEKGPNSQGVPGCEKKEKKQFWDLRTLTFALTDGSVIVGGTNRREGKR